MKQEKITFAHILPSAMAKKLAEIAAQKALPENLAPADEKPKQNNKKISRLARKKRLQDMDEIRKFLHLTYPDIFDYTAPKPLALKIHEEIWPLFPQHSHKTIQMFLKRWVQHGQYLQAVIQSEHRYNLAGEVASAVLEHEKEFAKTVLSKRPQKTLLTPKGPI